jgi:hypothetical protein
MRRAIFMLLSLVWASAPLLACLPTAAMTDAEMACCKKMAGNCEMGAGDHSCCKNAINSHQGVALASLSSPIHSAAVLAAVSTVFADARPGAPSHGCRITRSPIPISPPGSQSILRI